LQVAVAGVFLVVIPEGDLLLLLPLFLFLPLQFSFWLSSRRDLLLFQQPATNNHQPATQNLPFPPTLA
jgi:hypothetical protein